VVNPDGSKTRLEILEEDEAAVEPAPVEDEVNHLPPRTHAEADVQAAERGLTFPEDVLTVKEKAAFLAAQD
jgi:hypothetical protein